MRFLKNHFWLILALVVAVLAGRMLLTTKHFYTHDDIQVIRVYEFAECLKSGQIPCRWAHNLGKGYGYPWFNYYPPMIYVLPTTLYFLGFSLVTSLNVFVFLTFILAAWSMYSLVKELALRPDLAFLSSVLYTLYPFHATNVFVRGVLAENLAWSFAPLIFLVIYRQVHSSKFQKSLPLLFAGLFLTHIISSFVLGIIAFAWMIILIVIYQKNLVLNLKRLVIASLIGAGISAFFLAPAILEKNLVQSESLTQGYYAHTNHYVSFFQLFVEYKWNYSASLWGEAWDEMPFMVGHVHTLLFTLVLGLVIWFRPSRKNISSLALSGLMSLMFLGLLLLAHFKSDPIWTLVPSLAYIQFPWRFIVWAGLPLTIAISLLMSLLPKKLTTILIFLATIILVSYSYPFFFSRGYDAYQDSDYIGGGEYKEQQNKSLYDYLPSTVQQIPDLHAEDSDFPIPVFYFPGWTATIDGQPVAIQASTPYGLIEPVDSTIDPETLELTWKETPFRKSMDLLSLFALLAYTLYLYKSHVQ